ncbi:MAG: T9SS type A sorting domain-containing protein [Bacteroidia bacterium]
MKKIYITFLLLLNLYFAYAQPVLTAANTNPVIGESFTYHNWTPSGFSPGASGANATWNFSTTTSTSVNTIAIVTPSSTPNGSLFPNANLAYSLNGSYDYQLGNSTYLARVGAYSTAVAIPYSNEEKIMTYPFNFNSTFNDPWAASFVSGGYTFNRSGTTDGTADGYGTLILPGGVTLSNVMRIHLTEVYTDVWAFGTIDYNSDIYEWIAPGIHYPVFSYSYLIASGSPYYGGTYMDAASLGIDNSTASITMQVYPNPVTDFLHVQFETRPGSSYKISLVSSLGQEKILEQDKASTTNINATFDIKNYKSGMYLLRVETGDGVSTRKITLTR